jgi:hypothetical protein
VESISSRYRVSSERNIYQALLVVKVGVGPLGDEQWSASVIGEGSAAQYRVLLSEATVHFLADCYLS